MIASAYPEANRLAYRIRTAITGESTGLETAKLAWQYAEATARANADLTRSLQALAEGTLLDSLLVENAHPRLLETARSLDHALVAAWKTRCQTYAWRVAEPIDSESVSKLQAAIDEQGDLKDWLFKQYRAAVRSKKNAVRSYQIIELIADRFPEDANAKEELATKRAQLVELAVADVKDAHEHLLPTETPKQVAQRYVALGLPLSDSANPTLAHTLAEAQADYHQTLATKVHTLVETAKDLSETTDWQATERAYQDADYTLAINEARGQLETELRAELEKISTQLARIRSKFESHITLRLAIAEIRHGATNQGKTVPLANRVAKLKSLETQTTKTGNQIPPDLQAEIKAAYTYARRKRLPLYGAIAATLVIAALATTFLIQQNNERDAAATLQAQALAALQATEQSGQTAQVQKALETWSQAIAQAEPTSSLASQAALLQDWLSLQTTLETQYASSVNQLAQLATAPDALANETAINTLAATIRKTRADLATDLGQTAEQRFTQTLAQFETDKAAILETARREIARVERELRIAANNATQAKTRAEFERLQTAAETRAQTLTTLLQANTAAASRAQLAPFIQSVSQQLSSIQTKWAALDNAWLRLAEIKELPPYLDQLERIHSFDILPAETKNAISQTLRLKAAFTDLKSSQKTFANAEAQQTFANGQSYLDTPVQLSPEEQTYIARLQALKSFSQVYQSTVQYFEGSADPQSEYNIYLVEPIANSEPQKNASHVAYTFRVRGYDEFGNPEAEARDNQFLSRADGSFWGFFYKPSTLSPESQYYASTLSNTLNQLASGADRFTILKQLQDLEKQDKLSPAFRVYWQQQLIGFMQLQPWKWGLALTPALQKRATQLKNLPSGDTNETLWLSTIEQTVPSPEYNQLLKETLSDLPQKEVRALASLYQNAAKASYQLAGYVLADAKADLLPDVSPQIPLYTVNPLTGTIAPLQPDQPLTPFAPLLRYTLPDGDTPAEQLRKTTVATGLKLAEPPYKPLLPALYQ